MPGRKAFRRIFLSVSNSGARDTYGISMKMTKVLFKNSEPARELIYKLFAAMARTGFIPPEWKVDIISFLYKKKGDRMDAKNWRPITIAASFGKHFEKLTLFQIRRVWDRNSDNHAYIADCSCLTAVLALMEFVRKVRLKNKEDKEFFYVPIVQTDDVSSAFESIDHQVLVTMLEGCFINKGEFDIAGVVRSYLEREADIVDRRDGSRAPLPNTVPGKISPGLNSQSVVLEDLRQGLQRDL